ncbi:acyl-CoA dehydrogenase family protein [Yinghuangia seranimata]|uniref:acyl-CoA dehydrogenase family protein n=1 Tax=Yinghuangia seranimata TaxID=408067 RepID=UPI00248BCD14|nr:acyl-CoA dehydrogenase family protein [Yinghuangia seranimata]MDI2127231.1 acyl-CoA dehydrogenase family protein [Yinghuangia seranimata]
MARTISSEQQAFVDAVRDFVRRECGTRERRLELTDGGTRHHNGELYGKMAGLGWLGVGFPEELGGAGGGMVDACLFLEESAYGMAPIGGHGPARITAGVYQRYGSEAQRTSAVKRFCEGAVLSISMSEPGAGSDVGALTCRAERTSHGWRINGQKTWCSNAHFAESILLIARTNTDGDKHEGLTMFHVPAATEGLDVRGISTMGGNDVNDLFFTDVELPADAVVGEVDHAWRQLMGGLNTERLILAAMMLGTARRAFDDTLDYVRQREQFGRPIGSFQALAHRIADLATELECCELLVYSVAERVDRDPARLLPREASMVKLKVTETAKRIALEGMQMMGGYGYATEYEMERHVRATVVSTIYGGTSEIQREIIAKTYGL